ncbi:hypothetical protein AB1Y20_013528 [Prymnesium parvum]|uniref:Mechanosensitive ion channel protein n=1 Tax=Prymnesium parvum TaxID=97485 RepID=A0AB34IHJ9_PRYPA
MAPFCRLLLLLALLPPSSAELRPPPRWYTLRAGASSPDAAPRASTLPTPPATAADPPQSLPRDPTDHVEGMLLEELEAAAPPAASPPANLSAAPLATPPPAPPQDAYDGLITRRRPRLWRRVPSQLRHEAVQLAAVAPLLFVVVAEAPASASLRESLGVPLWYCFAAARLVSLLFELVAKQLLRFKSVFDRVTLAVKGSFGWPSTVVLALGLGALCPSLDVDAEKWRALLALPHFLPTCYWLLAAAVSRPIVDVLVKCYINALTLSYYEQRADEVHQAQTVLRAIGTAARSAEREMKELAARRRKEGARDVYPRVESVSPSALGWAPSEAPAAPRSAGAAAERGEGPAAVRPESTDRHSTFSSRLTGLAGGLNFGTGYDETSSMRQARRRATRIFNILKKQPELLLTDSPRVALSRSKLLAWSSLRAGVPRNAVGENVLLRTGESVEEEAFVTAIVRCYKESRLLTAAVDSFDQINGLLYRVCISAWGVAFALALAGLWQGRDVAVWVIPAISVLASIGVILGKAPSDILSGAIYTLVFRQFDIGDRVVISNPGSEPRLGSLIVKKIDAVRTHFLTAMGELLIIENHILRGMCITNLSRSGMGTVKVSIQVPVVTPASKITELADGIKQYCLEKDADWNGVKFFFSGIDSATGHLTMDIAATSKHRASDALQIDTAKSELQLFVHAFMQSANIEYVKPVTPVRIEKR